MLKLVGSNGTYRIVDDQNNAVVLNVVKSVFQYEKENVPQLLLTVQGALMEVSADGKNYICDGKTLKITDEEGNEHTPESFAVELVAGEQQKAIFRHDEASKSKTEEVEAKTPVENVDEKEAFEPKSGLEPIFGSEEASGEVSTSEEEPKNDKEAVFDEKEASGEVSTSDEKTTNAEKQQNSKKNKK